MIKISGYLTGCLLVALPDNKTDEFHESVIFLCKHDEHGAMGFIINQVFEGINLLDLLQQTGPSRDETFEFLSCQSNVFWGGPIEDNHGFVLHSIDTSFDHTVPINDRYCITANPDILKAIVSGKNEPTEHMLLLGYVGWQPKQLEKEIAENSWLPIPATSEIIFQLSPQKKWAAAIKQLGTNVLYLSPSQGAA